MNTKLKIDNSSQLSKEKEKTVLFDSVHNKIKKNDAYKLHRNKTNIIMKQITRIPGNKPVF